MIETNTYKLTIKRSDDSIYWTEHFNYTEDLVRWIDEEKTRPYWIESYVIETVKVNDDGSEENIVI